MKRNAENATTLMTRVLRFPVCDSISWPAAPYPTISDIFGFDHYITYWTVVTEFNRHGLGRKQDHPAVETRAETACDSDSVI